MRPIHLLLGIAAYCLASAFTPYESTHRLDAVCRWQRSGPLGALFDPAPDEVALQARARCVYGRGLRSHTPFLKTILARWPGAAQMRRLEAESYANRRPLPSPPVEAIDVQPGGER